MGNRDLKAEGQLFPETAGLEALLTYVLQAVSDLGCNFCQVLTSGFELCLEKFDFPSEFAPLSVVVLEWKKQGVPFFNVTGERCMVNIICVRLLAEAGLEVAVAWPVPKKNCVC